MTKSEVLFLTKNNINNAFNARLEIILVQSIVTGSRTWIFFGHDPKNLNDPVISFDHDPKYLNDPVIIFDHDPKFK